MEITALRFTRNSSVKDNTSRQIDGVQMIFAIRTQHILYVLQLQHQPLLGLTSSR
jgi:hypothetical protein